MKNNKQIKQMIAGVYSAKYQLPVIWLRSFHHPFIDNPNNEALRGVTHDAPVSIKASEVK